MTKSKCQMKFKWQKDEIYAFEIDLIFRL